MSQDRTSLLPLKKSDVDLKQSNLDVEPVVSSVSISGQFSNEDLSSVDDLIQKIFNQYSKVKSEFETLSDSSTTNSDSAWAKFDNDFLEPAKIAFDKDKQEITQKRNKKPSSPQAEDVIVTPPANEDATNTYTKFYQLLTSKTSDASSATLKLPLEFSEYPKYVQTNFGEFNTDNDKAVERIITAIGILDEHPDLTGISIETFNNMNTGSLNLFFALLFFRCMNGQTDKNMNMVKLVRALPNLSLDKIGYIIEELSKQKPNYSFVDIIDKLNEQLFNNKSQLAIEINPSSQDTPGVSRVATLNPQNKGEWFGGSSSTSKKNRKSHKSYHPDIGKTRKHHHTRHKKVSFVH
jgi:hypothetical protein